MQASCLNLFYISHFGMCEYAKIRIYLICFLSRVQSLEKGKFFQLYVSILDLKFVDFTLAACIYFNLYSSPIAFIYTP